MNKMRPLNTDLAVFDRLPIIQGGCHKFLPAITALMALDKWKCPDITLINGKRYGISKDVFTARMT